MTWSLPFKSLRTGLLLTYLALIATSVGLLGWRIGASLDASRFVETRRDQEGRAILAASASVDWLSNYYNGKITADVLCQEISALAQRISQPVALLDSQGRIVADSEDNPYDDSHDPTLPEIQVGLTGQATSTIRYDPDDLDDVLFTIAPVIYQKQIL